MIVFLRVTKSRFTLSLVFASSITAAASIGPLSPICQRLPLRLREAQFWASSARRATFEVLRQSAASSDCESIADPEAVDTPNPLMNHTGPGTRIALSFIVGIDGRVHSPLILQNADESQGATLIDAVNQWRYRPAMCKGAPVESEGRVEFSQR